MRWFASVLALLLVMAVSGCGHGKPTVTTTVAGSVSPAATRIENRLKAHGYTMTIQRKIAPEPYEGVLTVTGIDFTSPSSFDVNIYLFTSKSKAEAQRKRFTSSKGAIYRNRSTVVGTNLFVASHHGVPVGCKMVNGSPRCPAQPAVPLTEFKKFISVVTG